MNFPDWICHDCGRQIGRFYVEGRYVGPAKRISTFHEGTCDVCGKTKPVTEPRDYGYLIANWQHRLKRR